MCDCKAEWQSPSVWPLMPYHAISFHNSLALLPDAGSYVRSNRTGNFAMVCEGFATSLWDSCKDVSGERGSGNHASSKVATSLRQPPSSSRRRECRASWCFVESAAGSRPAAFSIPVSLVLDACYLLIPPSACYSPSFFI